MSTLAPFGFQAGQSRRSVNEYYVAASDTTTLAVGDPVKTDGNVFVGRLPDSRQSSGMLHVTKAASGNAVRGVIVGIVAGPGDNSAQSLPATKQRAYTVLVNDNPQALWDVQANNTAPLSAMAGMYASYAVGAPLGSVSSTVVDADSIGSTVSDLLIAEVLRNDGANSLLRVAFVQHEMAAAGGSPQIGAQIQSLVSRYGIQTAKRAVVIGDSIMGQSSTIENYDPTSLDATVGEYSLRARGFVNALNLLLGQALEVVHWGGITGQVVREIATRESTVFNRVFDVVIENGGTNDVALFDTEHGGSLTVCEDAVVASRIARWQNAISKGAALVIALDCLPVGSSSTYTAAQKYCLLRINARLAAAALSYPAVRWVDGTAAIVDPTSATGLVRASTLHDNDRHPSAYGAWLLAKQAMTDSAIAALEFQRPVLSSALDCIQADTSSKNLLNTATGLVTGATGAASGTGMSGTVVTKLTGSRQSGSGVTIVASVVVAPNGIGNAQRFVMSGGVSQDRVRALILPAITVTEFPPGSWGYFECMVKIAGGVNLQSVTVLAGTSYAGGSLGGNLASAVMSYSTSETGGAIADETFFMRSPPVLLPADASSLTFIKGEVLFVFGGSSGAATADMYCMRWVKL